MSLPMAYFNIIIYFSTGRAIPGPEKYLKEIVYSGFMGLSIARSTHET